MRSRIYWAGLSLWLACAVAGITGCSTFRAEPPRPVTAPRTPAARDGGGEAEQHLQRGDELLDQGDTRGAVAEYSRALELQPGYSEAFNNRAFVEWHAGDDAAAIADFSEAIRLRPDYVNALTNRAFVYFDENDFVHSVSDASRAIELDPEDDSAFMIRGNAETRLGQWANGLADMLQAFRLRQGRKLG